MKSSKVSSAISMPRARRAVWYENDNIDACEVGLSYETSLIYTCFNDEGYNTNIVENMQEMIKLAAIRLDNLTLSADQMAKFFDIAMTQY